MANPLIDAGLDKAPDTSTSSNPLIAASLDQAPAQEQEASVSAHPVTDEVSNIVSNVAKQTPRRLMQGLGALADLPGNVWDTAFHPDEEPHPMAHLVAQKLADKLEQKIPLLQAKNQGPIERTIGAAQEAGVSALAAGPEGAADAFLPSMASGAASQMAAESGAGPTGQTIAGLLPLAPSALAAGVRGTIRGGAEGAAKMEQNLAEAKNAGINLSAGQASGNKVLQGAETISSKIPVGNGPIATTRGEGLNHQVEESVSNIVRKISPDYNQTPPTPTTAGETIQAGVDRNIEAMKNETSASKEAMEQAVGGKETPFSAPTLESTLAKVTGQTGIDQVDQLVTGAKTRAVAKTVKGVTEEPKIPTSYNTDGEGFHSATSPNGTTHAVEDSSGNLKIVRSDTDPAARGKGEGTSRLETLAQAATAKGKNLVSDVSVSPAEAAAYEKLGRKGWVVSKNPKAEINPDTGNTISDSPKNPVYTVVAPQKDTQFGTGSTATSGESHFTGEWTYNPKTGKSEPVTSPNTVTNPDASKAVLNPSTPWTFDSLRQLRTNIGQGVRSTIDPVKRGQLKMLYGAISEDLKAGVATKGPQAAQSYELFNSVAKQNAESQKVLLRAINKIGGPEQVFKAALNGTKDGASKLAPIFSTLDEDGKNLIRATVLHRMGRMGGAVDASFDANTLLKNWQAMSPEAKDLLFTTKGGWGAPGQLRSSLDSLSNTVELLKKQGYIKSGLGKETSAVQHTVMGGVLALLAERAAETGGHLMAGNHLAAVGALAGGAGALSLNPVMSRVLTNPRTTAWLAQATKAPKAALPILINQLNQMGTRDKDARDLALLIQQSENQ